MVQARIVSYVVAAERMDKGLGSVGRNHADPGEAVGRIHVADGAQAVVGYAVVGPDAAAAGIADQRMGLAERLAEHSRILTVRDWLLLVSLWLTRLGMTVAQLIVLLHGS